MATFTLLGWLQCISMGLQDFHILSDFDGVWTEPARELERVKGFLGRELARLSGCPETKAASDLQDFSVAVHSNPSAYGWQIEGRFSSYVDEDYFAIPTALGQWIDEAKDEVSANYREAVLDEFSSVLKFLDHCYHTTCTRFREEVSHDFTPGVTAILNWLKDQGVRLTFVSNAPLEKIEAWFKAIGFDIQNARESSAGRDFLRVYGRAGKQLLSDSPVTKEIHDRRVAVDRPFYEDILKQEQADFVLGDVFSLDLALPFHLREEGKSGAPLALGMMDLPHTPGWVRQQFHSQVSPSDHLLPHITSLPRVLMQVEQYRNLEAVSSC